MPSIEKWNKIALNLSSDTKSYGKFYNAMGKSKPVVSAYSYGMNRFMNYLLKNKKVTDLHNFDELLQFTPDQISDILEDYIASMNKLEIKTITIKGYVNGVKLFLKANRIRWFSDSVNVAFHKDDHIPGGGVAATDEDVQAILDATNNPMKKALIHFIASTGIRPGALNDPILKMKHLTPMPGGCKAIKVYDESREGYWAFLTPEATKFHLRYINFRKERGELIDDESPLFRPTLNTKVKHLRCSTARDMMYDLIEKAGIIRVKTGNRYDKAAMYMFRKRFNGKLKMDNQVNSNIAEKLMAHKRGLDGTYLVPTKEECFAEFKKAIIAITVDPAERQKIEIQKQEEKITELEKKDEIIDKLEDKIDHEHEQRLASEKDMKQALASLRIERLQT